MASAREIHLASRPEGAPVPENFRLVETELPEPAEGQVLVRNTFLSVDPYMRGRMSDAPSYVPPYEVGAVMNGGAVGEVVESRAEGLAPGDVVFSDLGWRDAAVADARVFTPRDPQGLAPSVLLGALGLAGWTAWVGLVDIAGLREGDVVFVSAAAGSVGAMAGQIARLRGAERVVGSAGSADKVAYVTGELGFDAAFNYKDGPVVDQLREAAPDGIDVYFDNVGADHLEAAIACANDFARVAACGAIAHYNDTDDDPTPGPSNLFQIVKKRLSIQGFIVTDSFDRMRPFLDEVTPSVAEGRVKFAETVVEGIDHAVEAFRGMLRGENTGKMIVAV